MDFKKYAGVDLGKWRELVNFKIEHSSYGVGTIRNITINDKDEGIILHINFNGKIVRLNDRGLCKYYFIISDKKSEKLLNKFEGLIKPPSGYVEDINHCWNCGEVILSTNTKCPKCGWYKCKSCGSCGCGYIY
jgi:hypothetical protein